MPWNTFPRSPYSYSFRVVLRHMRKKRLFFLPTIANSGSFEFQCLSIPVLSINAYSGCPMMLRAEFGGVSILLLRFREF